MAKRYIFFNGLNSATFASNYYYSSIRKWLNEVFLGTAFNAAQKENIKITTIDNSCYDPSKTEYNAPSSNDKVFLLSYNDAFNKDYGFSSSNLNQDPGRQANGTDYAKCQGLYCDAGNDRAYWWLRTPFYSSDGVFYVYPVGGLAQNTETGASATWQGVRPACCLNELKDDSAQIGGVNAVSVSYLKINYKASTSLTPQITADDGAAYTVQYTSSDTNVVTVDENGNLYAAKKGTVEITVRVTDEFDHEVTDSCKVTVKYTFPQWLIVIVLFGWIWY